MNEYSALVFPVLHHSNRFNRNPAVKTSRTSTKHPAHWHHIIFGVFGVLRGQCQMFDVCVDHIGVVTAHGVPGAFPKWL